jgi:hypothetical protein
MRGLSHIILRGILESRGTELEVFCAFTFEELD